MGMMNGSSTLADVTLSYLVYRAGLLCLESDNQSTNYVILTHPDFWQTLGTRKLIKDPNRTTEAKLNNSDHHFDSFLYK